MRKYLLSILILLFTVKSKMYSQIITVPQRGRKIISIQKPVKDLAIIADPFAKNESEPIINPGSKIDFDGQLEVKQRVFLSSPLEGKLYVTSYYGERYHPVFHKEIVHAGIDLRAGYEMVNSIAKGIVVKEGYDLRAGNYVVIGHGNGIESIYCHLSKFLLKTGDWVFAGDGIAISGATGAVTAPHLHFAVKENGKFIDPLSLLKAVVQFNKKENY